MRAFTLVEVLVIMLILVFIVLGIYSVLNVGRQAYNDDLGLLDLHQQARRVIDGMVRELRQAKREASRPITISQGGTTIEFYIPNVSSSIRYYRNANNQVIREHPSGTLKILSNDITNLCFCWDSSNNTCLTNCTNIFSIHIDASKTVMNNPLSFSLTEKVRLRNE